MYHFADESMFEKNTNAYFEDIRAQYRHGGAFEADREFNFKHTRINNSPYVFYKTGNSMEIVREGNFVEETFKHNRCINMDKSSMRPDFVQLMGSDANEGRFNLNDFYDKSSYLTKV